MEDLIRKWQSGDEGAFDELFHQFKWLVFKNALIISGSREEAEDILQEVFVKVWESRNTFDAERGNFISWLYRMTINHSISKYRKKKVVPLTLDEDRLDLLDSDKKSLETVSECKLENDWIKEIVDQMNEKHRLVLILRYFNYLSNSEIAEILDIPVGTVKSRIYNALVILRKEIGLLTKE